MKRGWVYILECADGSYYTGCTSKPEQRIAQHQAGTYSGYTATRRPVKVLWFNEFTTMYEAISAERQIKGWSRKKKKALIKGDFDLLHELAQSKEVQERREKEKNSER